MHKGHCYSRMPPDAHPFTAAIKLEVVSGNWPGAFQCLPKHPSKPLMGLEGCHSALYGTARSQVPTAQFRLPSVALQGSCLLFGCRELSITFLQRCNHCALKNSTPNRDGEHLLPATVTIWLIHRMPTLDRESLSILLFLAKNTESSDNRALSTCDICQLPGCLTFGLQTRAQLGDRPRSTKRWPPLGSLIKAILQVPIQLDFFSPGFN